MPANIDSEHPDWPFWFNGKRINEPVFCDWYLEARHLAFSGNTFFSTMGRVDENKIREDIYRLIRPHVTSNVPNKVTCIMDLLKMAGRMNDLPPQTDRIHLANGTLYLDGRFESGKKEIVRSRLPVAYTPAAPAPSRWLSFLDGLLWPEDLPTLQEYIR